MRLEDVTPKLARQFRQKYLPHLTTPRAPDGLSPQTVNKNITLLAGV